MRLNKILVTVLVLTMVFAGSLPVMAKNFREGHHMHGMEPGFMGPRILMELDLTDSQKAKVKAIFTKYRDKTKDAMDSLREAGEKLEEVTQAEEFSEENIRQAFAQVSSVGEELVVLRAKIFAELKTVLDTEQIELLKERHTQRAEWIKKHIDFGRSMFNNWLGTDSE